ncbi:MAG: hypothetical protein Q8L14_24865 [Myxococcales bacterium]|nr:hypothetical protein [Myxococcales bacterium]
MDEWMQCQTCGLKYRARADGCPRCAKAAAEQPIPDLRDQIPESPVYEPPRYEGGGEARITEYATGDAASAAGPFRLPWYLLGGTVVFTLLGAVIAPARPAIGALLLVVGMLFSLGASLWTLSVCWSLGIAWVIGALFVPLVGLFALFRANNLRPLGLHVAATFMVGGGFVLLSQSGGAVRSARAAPAVVAELRDPTREEYVAECTKQQDAFRCACQTAALYDELGQDIRLRVVNGQATRADTARLNEAVTRNCKGTR